MKIGDICESVSEPFKSSEATLVTLINTSDVADGKVTNHTKVANENLKGQLKKSFSKDDILYSEIRPCNKHFALIDFEPTGYIASTKLMVIRANKEIVIPAYLYHYLTNDKIIKRLQLLAETRSGTFPQITFSEISNLDINLPSIDRQRKVVAILSALDNKIEVNRAINKNLEKQVSSIYESWFENFDLNNGRCPDKWKYKTLADIACVSSGKRPQVKSEHFSASTPIPIIGAASVMGFTSKANYTDKILVTGRVGTHGIIQRFHAPCWTSDNTLVITSQYYEFTNQVLRRINYSSMNRGSTQPLITQSDMNKVTVLVPDKYDLLNFEKISGKLMNLYNTNNEENQRLAAIRDAFLPKLMSGEIDVSQVKI